MINNVAPWKLSCRKQTIAHRFERANNYDQHANIQQQVCELLLANIQQHNHYSVLEIGAGTGQMTRMLASHIQSKNWVINELSVKPLPYLQSLLPTAKIAIGDAETIDLGNMHSLIISANAIQWFDEPLDFVRHSYHRLQPGGQILFNTFTADNFSQIKTLTGQGLDYPAIDSWQKVLQKWGFEQIELSVHRFELSFARPYDVLKHMKLTGVSTSATAQSSEDRPFIWSKAALQRFETAYWQQFAAQDESGKPCVKLTYEALLVSAFRS